MKLRNVEDMMERLGRSGVTVIVKVDHERASDGDEPWTVVLSGPGVGDQGFIRAEGVSLVGCLDQVFQRLRARGDQWSWLADIDVNRN
ncbi:hypothetical protein SacmaDRAFT_3810 [Saccharomonospora marina XMU15]|uniref:Uncharacterized protein n=1 Tax=Saccharomonospora marina XMU15 TaxID=882083 RepID=H5X1V0_9PSEU|nr:hypothetical protein SacmaDRAFT_3810 [Saccharomonospora marina XMU15]